MAMADIPQWRRRIPPSRSRTPMFDVSEPEQDVRSATTTRPPTPKKGLRPKLSSYLSQSGPFATTSKPEPEPEPKPVFANAPVQSLPSWAVEDTYPDPSAEQLIDTILCRLMSQTYDTLDTRFNGALLRIFEAYRDLSDQRNHLEKKLIEEMDSRLVERAAMQEIEHRWEEEKQTYKAEVKRLELVIAKGKRGVAEVALVRQDSLIRRRNQLTTPDDEDDGKETVFEFLEKTKRFEDPSWSGQRATMKTRPASPSAMMAKLSRKLTKKVSKTSILAELPFGTPPPHLPSTSLLQASYLEDQAKLVEEQQAETRARTQTKVRLSFSDDTNSTFSCAGDLLPDERNGMGLLSTGQEFENGSDHDIDEIRQMAATLSSRRGISAESVMPRLLEMFRSQAIPGDANLTGSREVQLQRLVTAPVQKTPGATTGRKPSNLKGILNRLRPQLSLETLHEPRRFSFEIGDDSAPIGASKATSTSCESLLRKSVSLSSLSETARRVPPRTTQGELSPIASSPTTSAFTNDSRRTSKIPSPTYNAALAKPRQQREGSTSSLLTATKGSEYLGQRSSSAASSVYSSHSRHQVATDISGSVPRTVTLDQASTYRLEHQRRQVLSSTDAAGTTAGRQLIDHINAVRAGTSIGDSMISVRDGGGAGNADVPSLKLHSSTRGVNEGRSRTPQNASTQLIGNKSENARPSLHIQRGGKDDETVVEDRQVLQEMGHLMCLGN